MTTDVNQLVTTIRNLGPITAEQRAALKAAAAATALVAHGERWQGPMERPNPWATVREVAEWLRIDTQAVLLMCERGDFGPGAAFRLSNRKGSEWRIRRSHLEAWYARQINKGGAA